MLVKVSKQKQNLYKKVFNENLCAAATAAFSKSQNKISGNIQTVMQIST